MAPEWEMAMGMDLGMGMGTYTNASSFTTAPMNHSGSCFSPAHHLYGMPPPPGDALPVDDLLDLSNAGHEFFPSAAVAAGVDNGHHLGVIGEPSATTASASSSDHQTSFHLAFADEFYIPSEEAAELEWLSKFVDDSYSDIPNYASAAHAAMAAAAATSNGGSHAAGPDNSAVAPGRGARSKRSRATAAAAAAWHSLVPRPPSQSSPSSSSSSSDFPSSKPARSNSSNGSRGKKNAGVVGAGNGGELGVEGGVRRCTHCASEKTPQWRTGPLGPKTLCNACGVRYKSGRLMPEYRPAASPTFVLTQHSNSHRKVMELRRQKELILLRGSHRDAAAAAATSPSAAATGRPELLFRDYSAC